MPYILLAGPYQHGLLLLLLLLTAAAAAAAVISAL
jgi:hypothetical protein